MLHDMGHVVYAATLPGVVGISLAASRPPVLPSSLGARTHTHTQPSVNMYHSHLCCPTPACPPACCRAKRRRVNEAYVGTLSSYAYVLLVIHHLQGRSPAVLPVLQELPPTHTRTIGASSASLQLH